MYNADGSTNVIFDVNGVFYRFPYTNNGSTRTGPTSIAGFGSTPPVAVG